MRGERPRNDSVVQVSTDLPPQVDGQLRCFCKLSIPKIVWSIPKSPAVTHVRVKWWGEDGHGTIFRPLDSRKGRSSDTRTTARYPVRSGPMQFATYLKDMSSLTLDVLDNTNKSNPIGQAVVSGLSQLSTTKGIQKKLPVMSTAGQKIADLEVSLMLEHLMASYDCNGTIPTSDLNTNKHQEIVGRQAGATQLSSHSSTIAPISVNGYGGNHAVSHNIHGKRDAVAITANGDVVSLPMNGGQRISASNDIAPTSHTALPNSNAGGGGGDLLSMLVDRGKMLRDAMAVSAMHTDQETKQSNPPTDFMMNPALLNSPARHMDISLLPNTVAASPKTAMNILMGSPPVKKQDYQLYKFVTEGSPGTSLSSDFGLDHMMSEVEDPNHDHSLLQDLFYNDSDMDAAGHIMRSDGIPFDNYLHQHLAGLSPGHLNIPSSVDLIPSVLPPSISVQAPGNQRPPSRASSVASLNMEDSDGGKGSFAGEKKKKKVKRKARSLSRSRSNSRSQSRSRSVTPSCPSELKSRRDETKENTSIASAKDRSAISNSSGLYKPKKKVVKARSSRARERLLTGKKKSRSKDRDLTSASEASFVSESMSVKSDVDGLSVERLTLLGRVQVARVNVDILNLNKSNVWDLSSFFSEHLPSGRSKKSNKSKKPCAFFVEYQFPIVASSKDKYTPNAIATEVTRVASRNIKSGAVSFGHRSMYPVVFDGSVLERWWKSALVFRLYAREAGQNSPSLIGSGGISLKSILKSDNLFVKREVEIPDSNHDGLLNSSRSSINTTVNSRSSRSGVTIFGHLKISVELASDHKEFATALARTKLCEMSGNAKMVPMGGPQQDKARLVRQLNKNKDTAMVKSPVKKIDLPFDQQESVSRNANNNNNNNSGSGIVGLPPQSPRRNRNGAAQAATEQEGEVEGEDEIGMLKKQLKGLIGTMSVSAQQQQQQQQQQRGRDSNTTQDSCAAAALETPTLHCLLYIEEGRNMSINGIPPLHMANQQPALMHRQMDGNKTLSRNSYLACRMFWCSDIIHSQVCWNSLNPEFNFLQVSPVTLNSSLLEKLKDNYMIVEVWDKLAAAGTSDKLVGLVKLSLHQFYLSFRDRKIGNALLKSQYPVLAIDNYMPIIDLFSGLYFGQLKVVLAMGSQQQISMLQQAVVTGMQHNGKMSNTPRQDGVNQNFPAHGHVDHHFDIVVEGVRGLKVFEKMIWGEADCFVQFYFPSQGEVADDGHGAHAKSLTKMKCFRTATTLCIPDPVFHDSTQIKLSLPVGKPVQPELLIACSNPGEQGKGLPFEVWCRYYHPNVRDQRIAQGILPIAKLCAMVTMQHKPSQPCVQSFPIHLSQVVSHDGPGSKDLHQGKNTGLMDVAIRYSCHAAQGEEVTVSRNLSRSKVSLTVEVIRAAGLKAAAESVAQSDPAMAFSADVGVNSYIRIKLPSIGKENEKMTKTIAKSFIPEFSQCMNFVFDLALSDSTTSSHTRSLAELFEGSDAIFEIWHQTTSQGYNGLADGTNSKGGDVLLGSCSVPLVSVLTHSTGIHGWFPITQPQLSWMKPLKDGHSAPKNQVLGGVELSLRFADPSDREKVVNVGRGLGWSPLRMSSGLDRQWDEGSTSSSLRVAVGVEMTSFPSASAVRAGRSDLDPSTLCYVCYKLFDQGVTVSKSRKIHSSEGGALQSHIADKNEFHLPLSPDLHRYLQEKRLEIQVWVTPRDCDKSEQRPRQGDKLIGSCYIELDSLLDKRKKRQQISGSFPLFNGNSASLKSAFIRANIVSTIQLTSHSQLTDADSSVLDTDAMSDTDSTLTLQGDICVEKSPKKKRKSRRSGDIEASFSVVLALERAMHLPMVSERNRSSEVRPTTYVSYQSAEKSNPSHTSIFPNSCNPLWDYAVETRLSNEYLHKQNKNLVLKVWHKPSDASKSPDKSSDRVLGFVSVDLSPLAKGLNQLCGWYNIIDFTGQCRGQIKVSITPQDLHTSGGASDLNTSAFGASSLLTPPLCLTTGTTTTTSLATTQTAASTIAQQLLQLQQHVMSRMGSLTKNFGGDETTSTNNNNHAVSFNNNNNNNSNYQYFDTSEDMTTTTGTLSTNQPTPRLFSNRTGAEPQSTPRDDSSSKSFLFSTLRRQLADLDKVMEGFKGRSDGTTALPMATRSHGYRGSSHSSAQDRNSHEKSGDVIYGSHSELSTIRTASSLMNTRESSAPSRINNNSSSEVISSQEMQGNNEEGNTTDNNGGVNVEVPAVRSSKAGGGSIPKLSDSGIFSAKYCVEDGGKSGEEGMESGRTEKNMMMMTTSDNQSTLQSVFEGRNMIFSPPAVLEVEESLPSHSAADTTEKTQPFVPNGSNSESSQNSQGFALQKSVRNGNSRGGLHSGSPTKSDSTLKSGSVVGGRVVKDNYYLVNEASRSSGSKTHLEFLDGEVSDDESEEDKMFGSYHRYRDLLDAEEEDEEDELVGRGGGKNNEEVDDTVEIVPRNLNMSPLLHEAGVGQVDRVIETSVINSDVKYSGDDSNAGDLSGGERRDVENESRQLVEDVSPSRNIHEGTSVWYTEGSGEEEVEEGAADEEKEEKKDGEEVDHFQEVFERNQRLMMRERVGVGRGDEIDDDDDDDDGDFGEWMMEEKEVLGNQNVEEWLVHRSQDMDKDENDPWLKYASNMTAVNGDAGLNRDSGKIKRSEEKKEHEYGIGDQSRKRSDEMKLFLDEVSDHEYNNEGEGRKLDFSDESSDEEDTLRNEDDSRLRSNNEMVHNGIDSFFNVESEEKEVHDSNLVNGFDNLQIDENRDSIEMLHQQSERLLQSLEDGRTDFHSAMMSVIDPQTDAAPSNNTVMGQGARPKIRHMLSNVELDSETSNSMSRKNSKGSGASSLSSAARNGFDPVKQPEHSSSYHRDVLLQPEINDLEFGSLGISNPLKMNGCNGVDNEQNFGIDSRGNQKLGDSFPRSRDGSEEEEIIEEIVEEEEEEETMAENHNKNDDGCEERAVERRRLKGHNSTADSAFVDGECSEGHTTGNNNSAITMMGGHSSYGDDSCLGQSANTSSMLGQGHGSGQGQRAASGNGGGSNGNAELPNFFMNTEELQGSISALQKATAAANSITQKEAKHQNKVKAVSDLVHKIADSKTRSKPAASTSAALAKAKPPPSTDHAKRIAKIFSSKPT